MYDDLEPIANLKYGQVVESISHEMQSNLSESIASFSSRGLLHSGPMEAEKLRIRLDGCERICRSVYETWLDLITHRSGGRITREDIDFIMTKVDGCAQLRARDVRSTSQTSGVTTPQWAGQQADVKMHAVAADIRRKLEIKYREQEAFRSTDSSEKVKPAPPLLRMDPLLNIPDKGAFNTDLSALCGTASAQSPLSLILADVDRFKNVNDTYGYQVGDEVLKEVSQVFTTVCGHKGTVYRWGGEEFTVLLQNYGLAEAEALAERLRSHLANTQRASNPHMITASFGVSTFPEAVDEAQKLFHAANEAVQNATQRSQSGVRNEHCQSRPRSDTTYSALAISFYEDRRLCEKTGRRDRAGLWATASTLR
jgi:diguanylate cyclase (GGDEF)-like protein